MEKDFDGWNTKQKFIDRRHDLIHFSERQVWWTTLGINVGQEINGKHGDFSRPVLIVKKFNAESMWVVPITKTIKSGNYFHKIMIDNNPRTLSLLQLRMISAKRLLRILSKIEISEFIEIRRKLSDLLML